MYIDRLPCITCHPLPDRFAFLRDDLRWLLLFRFLPLLSLYHLNRIRTIHLSSPAIHLLNPSTHLSAFEAIAIVFGSFLYKESDVFNWFYRGSFYLNGKSCVDDTVINRFMMAVSFLLDMPVYTDQ